MSKILQYVPRLTELARFDRKFETVASALAGSLEIYLQSTGTGNSRSA
ncbi:MAG: hypothetical protein MUE44_21125 [Oscillatoriaceae cyanobacterium Prado104]|nr:hypothetical protein [Oscillatoriaceae cyanobacterium Prado104]